jgi:malonyl-CoA/methylmalonyl-CoA synthetase
MTGNFFVDALLDRNRSRTAPFLLLDDGSTVSFVEFFRRTGRLANALRAHGLRIGDRVLARFPKSPTHLALHVACIRSGIVLIPASPALGDEDYIDLSLRYAANLTIDERAIAALEGLAGHHSDEFNDAARGSDDIAVVMLTSGTTGKPKACMLTHENLVSSAKAVAHVWGMTEDDIVFHALPIYHTHGLLISTNAALAAGCALRFTADTTAKSMANAISRSSVVMGTPKIYADLLASDALTREVAAKVRVFISGGSPLSLQALAAFESRTGQKLLERHGMTEASVSASNPYRGERRPGTVGPAISGTSIRIVDPDTGAEAPAGAVGSVEIKGPNVFAGYLDDKAMTARVFRNDGWFITGDIGRLQEDGYLEIVARASDVIRCDGQLVDPREIEAAIDSVPAVQEAAVINVKQSPASDEIVCVVVRRPGQTISEQAILACLSQQLAPSKQPSSIRFVDALPRTSTGKVSKQQLRNLLAADPP